jgi:hypothetical protein
MRASQADRERWLAHVIQTALQLGIMTADDVLVHVTPELLAAYLPPDVMTGVLQASLKSGLMTPDTILSVAGPDVLCRHIPPAVLWEAAQAAAARAEIPGR